MGSDRGTSFSVLQEYSGAQAWSRNEEDRDGDWQRLSRDGDRWGKREGKVDVLPVATTPVVNSGGDLV